MRYYLAVVVEGEGDVVVVFPVSLLLGSPTSMLQLMIPLDAVSPSFHSLVRHFSQISWKRKADKGFNVAQKLLPGRAIVEEVWRGARQCLYEPKV